MDTSKPTINVTIPPPAPHKQAEEAAAKATEASGQAKGIESKVAPAAAHLIPKPVEVQSVPETPVNTASSVNGTPRPELNLSAMADEAEKPKRDDEGVLEPVTTAGDPASHADEPIVDIPVRQNGASEKSEAEKAEMAGALDPEEQESIKPTVETGMGEKRKLEDDAREVLKEAPAAKEDPERAEKKAKNKDGPVKGRPGRPRKDKSAPPVVGKTARKTRSQGPAEV
ncbi:hypothetical protein ESCO_002037 [Escovopsis weberi]|uniref:Uncharacterized protein n=1 Tax=Escovopsis weberi TaxID=150374 RepID=A0A0M9VW96_ESCWE|nr:hypothetical protein ESCO_002037 [Escovopsis weberi]